jgi:hypothetical protein
MTTIIILVIYMATQTPTRQSCKPVNVFLFVKLCILKVLPWLNQILLYCIVLYMYIEGRHFTKYWGRHLLFIMF